MRPIKQITLLLVLLVQVLVLGASSGSFNKGAGPIEEGRGVHPERLWSNGDPVLSLLPANDLAEDVVAVQEACGLSVSLEDAPDPECLKIVHDKLRADLAKYPDVDEFIKNTPKPHGVDAYIILSEHHKIRTDAATLTSVSRILENSGIASIISNTDLVSIVKKLSQKGVRCRTCASGNPAYKYLDQVLDDLEHGATKFGASYNKVIIDIKKGGNFTEGAMWVAEGVKKYANDFPAGTTVFEEVLEGGVRRVDVRVGNTFFEFKSTDAIPPSGFAEQFIKDMNLGEVSSLNQLKWWFDGKKVSSLPQQQFLDRLETGLQNLDPALRQSIINKFAPSNNQTLNGLLIKIDTDFTTIFSIK